MADEKSIYERWSKERLDPPLPKEWGLDEENEAELLWPIWPLLFMGESDTEQYVETITDNVMDVLGLESVWNTMGRTKTASSGKSA